MKHMRLLLVLLLCLANPLWAKCPNNFVEVHGNVRCTFKPDYKVLVTLIYSKHQLEASGQETALVWFYRNRNHGQEANTRGEEPERIYTRAPPKRVRRAFALLTKTYHGSRVTGDVLFRPIHLYGKRVYQALLSGHGLYYQ